MLRVLGLVPYPLGRAPGQRYRLEQWAPYLLELGIEVTFAPFAEPELAAVLYEPGHTLTKVRGMLRGLGRRLPVALGANRYDLIFVYREACLVGPAWVERIARARRPVLVYDFDDAVYLPYVSPTNRYFSYLKFPWKTAALCRMATSVIVGNTHLAGYAERYNRDVTVIPSTVSLREYQPRRSRPPGSPTVGWTGSHSSLPYLATLFPALQSLRERVEFRLLLVGVQGVRVPGIEVETRPWRSSTEVRDLWDIDVGVMPLPDEPWARAKCGMKAIQYMAVGAPAVVSPVGANVDLVEGGRSGVLARTDGEWVAALEGLLTDESERHRIGAAGRRRVEGTYSAEAQAPRVAQILRRAIA